MGIPVNALHSVGKKLAKSPLSGYNTQMENIFEPVWSKSSTEEQDSFYQESLANFIVRLAPNGKNEDQARSIAKEVACVIDMFVKIYGEPGDEQATVVKCGIPEDNDGHWIMDVNFSVRGIVSQIVVRDRTLAEMESKFVDRIKEMQMREELSRSQG